MGRRLNRGVALVGIGGTLLVGGAGVANAQDTATKPADPLGDLTKNLPLPTDVTQQLPQLPKLPVTLPTGLPALPLPSGPLIQICGIGAGLSGPINGFCPGSHQKIVKVTETPKPAPVETKTKVVQKVVHEKPVYVEQPVQTVSEPVAQKSGNSLAYTGFEATPIAAAGLAALIGGAVLTACARPRSRRA